MNDNFSILFIIDSLGVKKHLLSCLEFLLKYRKLKRRISTEKIEILNTQKQRITQQINKDKLQIQEYKNIFTAEMKNIQQVNTGGNPDVIESNQQYMGTITDDIYN